MVRQLGTHNDQTSGQARTKSFNNAHAKIKITYTLRQTRTRNSIECATRTHTRTSHACAGHSGACKIIDKTYFMKGISSVSWASIVVIPSRMLAASARSAAMSDSSTVRDVKNTTPRLARWKLSHALKGYDCRCDSSASWVFNWSLRACKASSCALYFSATA